MDYTNIILDPLGHSPQ